MLLRVCIACGAEYAPAAREQSICPVCALDLPEAEQAAARDAYALRIERLRYDQHRLSEWKECGKCGTLLPPEAFNHGRTCRACYSISRTKRRKDATPAEVRQEYRRDAAAAQVEQARIFSRNKNTLLRNSAPEGYLLCRWCKLYRPLDQFAPSNVRNHNYACKPCFAAYSQKRLPKQVARRREQLRANPEKWNARQREYMREYVKRPENRAKLAARAAKQAHERRGNAHPLDAPITPEVWQAIADETQGRCWLCHAPGSEADHIVPRLPRKGEPAGPNAPENFIYACKSGNASKNNKPLPYWLPRRLAQIEGCPLAQAQELADRLAEQATGRPAAEVWAMFTAEQPDYAALKRTVLRIGALYTPPAGWTPPVTRTRRSWDISEAAPLAEDWQPALLTQPLPAAVAVGKVCTGCNEHKGLDQYEKHRATRRRARCRACVNARTRAREAAKRAAPYTLAA